MSFPASQSHHACRRRPCRDSVVEPPVAGDFEVPLREMQRLTDELRVQSVETIAGNYLTMIGDNIKRIVDKLDRLKTLEEDKTVRYIKDIKMLGLS